MRINSVSNKSLGIITKTPRTVGQKLAQHYGISLNSVIKDWGGEKYMKLNGSLTSLGRDKLNSEKAIFGLPKKASAKEYIESLKFFSSLLSIHR